MKFLVVDESIKYLYYRYAIIKYNGGRRMVEKITIVLASPSDLSEERKMIKNLVDSFNTTYMRNNICIDLRMWENSTPGMNINGPQGRIDDDLGIDEADLFICMYWKKIGTKLQNENVAGTEHEFEYPQTTG